MREFSYATTCLSRARNEHGIMWRHSVKAEDLRLYFAGLRLSSEEGNSALVTPLAALRSCLMAPTFSAEATAEAATAVLSASDASGVRARVDSLAAACARTGAYDEQSAQQVIPGLWVGPLAPAESRDFLQKHRISRVLDATGGWRRRVSALVNTWVREPPPFADVETFQLAAEDRETVRRMAPPHLHLTTVQGHGKEAQPPFATACPASTIGEGHARPCVRRSLAAAAGGVLRAHAVMCCVR